MNLNRYLYDMKLLGFQIIGAGKLTIIYNSKMKVKKKTYFEKTLQDCIINDIIEACKEDLESKQNNCKIEKIIREIIVRGDIENGKI